MSLFQKALGTEKGINITNMALMVFSAIIAYIIPFKLFLFVYAVLGPLHYLTEISWLDRKKFFIEKKWHVWPYAVVSVLFTIMIFSKTTHIRFYATSLMAATVAYTLFITLSKKHLLSIAAGLVTFVLCAAGKVDDRTSNYFLFFSVLLPTIIHVFIFTGIFILAGAQKTKSKSGYWSFAVFIACAISFAIIHTPNTEVVSAEHRGYIGSYFSLLNQTLASIFHLPEVATIDDFFNSPGMIAIQRFIAFAYTYHYLNWFSKTSVIKWHEISKQRMGLILLLWALSVVAYYADYDLGFKLLFLLSMLHVFLEFPLNVVSIKGMGASFKNLFAK